jgi:hypothetical protein
MEIVMKVSLRMRRRMAMACIGIKMVMFMRGISKLIR